jgi:hypothetical protein
MSTEHGDDMPSVYLRWVGRSSHSSWYVRTPSPHSKPPAHAGGRVRGRAASVRADPAVNAAAARSCMVHWLARCIPRWYVVARRNG